MSDTPSEIEKLTEEIQAFLKGDNTSIEVWHDLIEKLIRAAERANIPATDLEAIKNLPQVISTKVSKIDFPLDKINSEAWRLFEHIKPNGQLTLHYLEHRGATEGEAYSIDVANATDRKAKKEVSILYALDFEALGGAKITKKLLPYDKRVYMAISALYNAGYDVMSLGQIYNALGHNGTPSKSDKEKINNSITKMNGAHIFIDNQQERKAGYEYDSFKYDASLLPMERLQAVINGNLTESAIHIFREPPLISFARGRQQITTIRREVLNSPLNKNDANIALEDYLIERIAHIKRGANSKILYSTIYENSGIRTAKQKQRAPEKIRKVLEHYKKIGYIQAYKEDAEGVSIAL